MPSYVVETLPCSPRCYPILVERGGVSRLREYVPARAGKIFFVSTEDVWQLHAPAVARDLAHQVLFFPGGETRKRLAEVEALAEQLVQKGADRASLIVAVGGGIVTDVAGFLAAIFMRGIPLIQIPTTLLGQVDAAIGGKTGVNLTAGKNLIGSFHQPLAVLIDPALLDSLPEREYRSGLYEIIKAGIIRDRALLDFLAAESGAVLGRASHAVDRIIAD